MRSSPRVPLGLVLIAAHLALGCTHGRPGAPSRPPLTIRVLAVNDFHGELEPATGPDGRRSSGAAVLASWLRAAGAERPGATLLVSAGDLLGYSPALSSVLQDEPTIAIMNALAGPACRHLAAEERDDLAAAAGDPRCDVVAALGNHELEEGRAELLRVTRGGDRADGPSLESPWRGARFPFLAANVVDRRTGRTPFPASVVREIGGARIGIVGAVLREVPDLVDPGKVDDLVFLDVAEAVNRAARDLVAQGVRAIVLVLHDGGAQEPYTGPTRADAPPVRGRITSLVASLDPEIDVVVTGHIHAFTNARLPNAGGRPVLVTQAFSRGTAFARIDLQIDRDGGDVVSSSAEIVTVADDAGRGLAPDREVARIVEAARQRVAPLLARTVAVTSQEIRRRGDVSDPGEWPLGEVLADALRAAMQADIGLVQTGALQADLPAGPVTWGRLYAVLPPGDTVVSVRLSGREIRAALERQWTPTASIRPVPYIVDVSGLEVVWDPRRPAGDRIVALTRNGAPLGMDATYTVAMPSALASAIDASMTQTASGREKVAGPRVIDAFETHLASLPQPIVPPRPGRVSRRR